MNVVCQAAEPSFPARLDYPIQALARAGIARIMVITGPESAGDFMSLLGSGREMGLEFACRWHQARLSRR